MLSLGPRGELGQLCETNEGSQELGSEIDQTTIYNTCFCNVYVPSTSALVQTTCGGKDHKGLKTLYHMIYKQRMMAKDTIYIYIVLVIKKQTKSNRRKTEHFNDIKQKKPEA